MAGKSLQGPGRPWRPFKGWRLQGRERGLGKFVKPWEGLRSDFMRDQHWSRPELFQVRGLSWVLPHPGCAKAGEHAGSTCAIDVEELKRRPPSKVGGLCHEFRV